jgi:hypothetical protein
MSVMVTSPLVCEWDMISLVADEDGITVTVDDWLPVPGTEDPIQRDWPEVVRTARELGYDLEQTACDRPGGTWLWVGVPHC